MQRWDSNDDIGNLLPSNDVEEQKSAASMKQASADSGNGTHADLTRTGRSIPDKILDRLVRERTRPTSPHLCISADSD